MDTKEIFVMNALKGILLINPENAEMLAVDKNDIREAVNTLENDIENKSCKAFKTPLLKEQIVDPRIVSGDSIAILPTFKCNFSCEYCFERNFSKEEMTKEMIPYIKKYIKFWNQKMGSNASCEKVGLMGGEVFRADDRELVKSIFEEFGQVEYRITTNGADLLLYKDLIKKYRPLVTVSLDGTEKMQLSRRKTSIDGVYQKILDGIQFLLEEGIETRIAVVFGTEFKTTEYCEFFDLLEELGWLKNKNLSVVFNVEMDEGVQGCNRERQLEAIIKMEQLLKKDSRAWYTGRGIIPGVSGLEKALTDKLERGVVNSYRCSANCTDSFIFAPDGYVYNCNLIKRKKNRIGQYYPEQKIFQDVVKSFQRRTILDIPECRECKMKWFCCGGCPVSAITKHGSVEKGFCGIWKDEEILKHIDLVVNVEELYQVARHYETERS